MAKAGEFVYFSVVIIGATPSTLIENSGAWQIRLIVSRRQTLIGRWTEQMLCSPFWRLYVNNRDGSFLQHNRTRIPLTADHIHLIPAWVEFETGMPDPCFPIRHDYLHFEHFGLSPTLQRRLFSAPLSLRRQGALDALCTQWQHSLAEAKPRPGGYAWAQAMAQAAIAMLFDALPPSAQDECHLWMEQSGEMGPALQLITDRLEKPPRNKDLATLCHLSEDHFIRKFRRVVGMTPAQFGLERRLTAAASWLAHSPRSLEDIAEATGFTDRFHFSRAFKKRLGVAPAAYRNLHRG